jgi:hypothetical protein
MRMRRSLSRRASAARTRSVTSLAVTTIPPPVRGSMRSSVELPSYSSSSRIGGAFHAVSSTRIGARSASWLAETPVARSSRGTPTRAANRSFQISSLPSASNTAMPRPT